ncbi:MAG: DNA translocase FtsK, partial [Clostridiales bacterium]|nr:DNA translocase FtsK [Clostridiales bacterium]
APISYTPMNTVREKTADEPQKLGAYSPFGQVEQMNQKPVQQERMPMDSREILFGGNPAENYKKNLLFDPNAGVNQRPIEIDPRVSEFVPSYTDSYQNFVNNDEERYRPAAIFTQPSQSPFVQEPEIPDREEYLQPMPYMPEEEPTPQEPISYPAYEEATQAEPSFGFGRDAEPETVEEKPYQRHEYMDYFSPSNPRLFENELPTREEPSERFGLRDYEEEPEERSSRGLDIFDEPDDNPYTLREEEPARRIEEMDITERGARVEPASYLGLTNRDTSLSESIKTPEQPKPAKPRIIRPYKRVPLDDFDCRDVEPCANDVEVEQTKQDIIATLEDFKVTGATIASVTFGPTVTRYNVALPRSTSPKKVVALDQSIAISLHSSGLNIYPNYEDGVVSIEVPNKERQFVQLGCMLSGNTFVNAPAGSLMFAMGKNVANAKIYGDISKMIHLLVAGSSGSGKSVFLGALIVSMIYKYSPEELRLILIDPKKTEFVLYNNLPHLMINEIITEVNKAVQSLNWAIGEMNRRYTLFEQMSRSGKYVVNLDQYNEQLEKNQRLPKIVIIIDELADLMLAAKKDIEDKIQNLTQKARAAGIHLIVATQRPSADVITGVIKSNLSTRIAFAVASEVDSRVILDQSGAQKLLGKGDFLYSMPGINTPVRVQSAFISPSDSQKVVNFIKANNEPYYDEEATAYINNTRMSDDDSPSGDKAEIDPMSIEALRHVILSGSASISMIQRKCSAGYNRAGKIIEWMEDMGYISAFDGAKARKVLITKEEFESKYGPL